MFTQDQLALQAHIEADNAEFKANAEANGATFICLTVSDPAHWAEQGVTTIAQFKRQCLLDDYSETHKEAYGFRPKWDFGSATDKQLQREIDHAIASIEADMKHEQEMKAQEQREHDARIQRNRYRPNNAFAGLRTLINEQE